MRNLSAGGSPNHKRIHSLKEYILKQLFVFWVVLNLNIPLWCLYDVEMYVLSILQKTTVF